MNSLRVACCLLLGGALHVTLGYIQHIYPPGFQAIVFTSEAHVGTALLQSHDSRQRALLAADDATTSILGSSNQHKSLLPMNAMDFVTFIVAALVLLLAAGAGIGGGAILVPLFILATGEMSCCLWKSMLPTAMQCANAAVACRFSIHCQLKP
jgi:hypothetical protein